MLNAHYVHSMTEQNEKVKDVKIILNSQAQRTSEPAFNYYFPPNVADFKVSDQMIYKLLSESVQTSTDLEKATETWALCTTEYSCSFNNITI